VRTARSEDGHLRALVVRTGDRERCDDEHNAVVNDDHLGSGHDDDPAGDYMFALGKRVDKLERDLAHLERQLHSRAGGGAILDPADG